MLLLDALISYCIALGVSQVGSGKSQLILDRTYRKLASKIMHLTGT
jgi:hypothetical protein